MRKEKYASKRRTTKPKQLQTNKKKTPNDENCSLVLFSFPYKNTLYFHTHTHTSTAYSISTSATQKHLVHLYFFVRSTFIFLIRLFAISHCLCVFIFVFCVCVSGSGRFLFVFLLVLPKNRMRTSIFTSKPKWDIVLLWYMYERASNHISYLWLCRPTTIGQNAARNKIMGRNEQAKIRHQVS